MGDDLAQLLDVLERKPDERLSINAMWNGRFQSRATTVAEAPQIAAQLVATDCWYGTGVLHERVTTGRGYARDVIGVRELYADLDYKPGALTPDTARAVIDDLAAMLAGAPVAIVHSGGGVQPHWQVDRSDATDWPDETGPMHGIVTALWRRWGRLVRHVAERRGGTVDGVYDLSRVLRVPGTVNTKYDPPRPVTVDYPGGAPVTLKRLADTLDEYGVPELPGDRDTLDDIVAPPDDWQWAEQTCRYVDRMIAGWPGDTPTARHPWLLSNAIRIAAAHRAGCITETDHQQAVETLAGRFAVLVGPGTALRPNRKTGPQPGEIPDAFSWGIARAATFDQARAWRELGNHHAESTVGDDIDFWNGRPELARIRLYAQAQMASPWAVLAVVLARVVCQVPVTVVLPATIYGHASLNLTIALVGISGGGKGGSASVAASAVRIAVPAFQTHTLGSGQGIAHGYAHWNAKTKAVERHAESVLFTVEEVDHLAGHHAQNGSTTLAELRRFGMGEKLGHLYVDPTKRVQIAAHTYRGAFVVGVQPGRAGVILDATDGGTPQRFYWAPTTDSAPPEVEPDQPDPWPWSPPSKLPDPDRLSGLRPIPVCQAATDAIRQGQRDRNAGKLHALDGHALLTRERIAAALGLLHGHYGITDEDWALAGTAMAVSDATRGSVVATLKAKDKEANRVRGEADADRAVIVEEKVSDAAVKRACRGILRYLTGKDWVASGGIRRSLASGLRKDYDTAAGMLVDTGQIEPEPTEYRGQTGQRYRLSRAER